MSNITTTISESSGFTRVTYGGPNLDEPAQANANPEQNRVIGGVTRVIGLQVQDSDGAARYSTYNEAPKVPGSVMSTLQRDARGQSVELEPGNPSSRTTLETAIRQGLVHEVSRGIFMDTQANPVQPATQQQAPAQTPVQQTPTEDAPFAFVNANDMALWNEDIAGIEQHVYDSTVASTVALAAGGNGSIESIASRLASEAGMEPELAHQYVTEGAAFYKDALSGDLVNSVGLPKGQLEQFYEWTRGKPALSKALSEMMHQGTTKTFRELAEEFKRHEAGKADVSAFTAAGLQTHVDRATGELMVRKGEGKWLRAKDL